MFNHEKKGIIQSIMKINGAVLIQGSKNNYPLAYRGIITSRRAFPGLASLSLFYSPNTICHAKQTRAREATTIKTNINSSFYIPDLQQSNRNN